MSEYFGALLIVLYSIYIAYRVRDSRLLSYCAGAVVAIVPILIYDT